MDGQQETTDCQGPPDCVVITSRTGYGAFSLLFYFAVCLSCTGYWVFIKVLPPAGEPPVYPPFWWAMFAILLTFTVGISALVGSWRLGMRGVSQEMLWMRSRFIAWDDVERVVLRNTIGIRSSSKEISIPVQIMATYKKRREIQDFMERQLGDRFDFSVLRKSRPMIVHPWRLTGCLALVGIWYGIVVPYIGARVELPRSKFLVLPFILLPGILCYLLIIIQSWRHRQDIYLPRKI